MILNTCAGGKHGASAPIIAHPCGKAARALDNARVEYELRVVGGFKNLPLSRRGKRDEIIRLTGGPDVPVLVSDDGPVVAGSQQIVDWAGRQ